MVDRLEPKSKKNKRLPLEDLMHAASKAIRKGTYFEISSLHADHLEQLKLTTNLSMSKKQNLTINGTRLTTKDWASARVDFSVIFNWSYYVSGFNMWACLMLKDDAHKHQVDDRLQWLSLVMRFSTTDELRIRFAKEFGYVHCAAEAWCPLFHSDNVLLQKLVRSNGLQPCAAAP